MNKVITNFMVPIDLRNRFDVLCHIRGKTRTAALVDLMEAFVLNEGDALGERNAKLAEIDRTLDAAISSGRMSANIIALAPYPIPMIYNDGRDDEATIYEW